MVLAACALPGVSVAQVDVDRPAGDNLVGARLMHYQDSQPGFKRITVVSPAIYGRLRLGSDWGVEGQLSGDSVSGATPRWHSSVSSASRMSDHRQAAGVKVTHYRPRSSLGVGLTRSQEDDYISNGVSLDATVSSEDNNTTWAFGLARAQDAIDATDGGYSGTALGKSKSTWQVLVGLTQVLSRVDVAQLNLTFSSGQGYFTDPYKALDNRPGLRDQLAVQLRWNHHLEPDVSTLRGSWRVYRDTFGILAQTVTGEWVKPLGANVGVTPLLRYHTQRAATFYRDALADPTLLPLPPGYDPANPPILSYDHRLAAFGAITLGLKIEVAAEGGWIFDLKTEFYEQRAKWRIGGPGSPGLDPLRARIVQVGASRSF